MEREIEILVDGKRERKMEEAIEKIVVGKRERKRYRRRQSNHINAIPRNHVNADLC